MIKRKIKQQRLIGLRMLDLGFVWHCSPYSCGGQGRDMEEMKTMTCTRCTQIQSYKRAIISNHRRSKPNQKQNCIIHRSFPICTKIICHMKTKMRNVGHLLWHQEIHLTPEDQVLPQWICIKLGTWMFPWKLPMGWLAKCATRIYMKQNLSNSTQILEEEQTVQCAASL